MGPGLSDNSGQSPEGAWENIKTQNKLPISSCHLIQMEIGNFRDF
jgi:hypothetical protein